MIDCVPINLWKGSFTCQEQLAALWTWLAATRPKRPRPVHHHHHHHPPSPRPTQPSHLSAASTPRSATHSPPDHPIPPRPLIPSHPGTCHPARPLAAILSFPRLLIAYREPKKVYGKAGNTP
ncbi:hypothetical protein E2C01_101506 [Portunus trituberculatus]|uniref:Uncharacterized protein n=1 Tax=Portunus trituberculatus TaxID=210409 RepID=A0A5B7KM51_PORTR|nr:hypothetical protein [Portunus trituberculatus]